MRTALWCLYAVFWLGGIVTGGLAPNASWAAPAFLILAGILAFRKELIPAVLIGFTAELIGVRTGFPFGRYLYTHALGPEIAGVPVAIAAAWLILASLTAVSGRRYRLLAALLMLAADLVIDPLAAGPLHYWRWQTNGLYYGVPLTNFAGWLAVSVLIVLITPRSTARLNAIPATVVAFFSILAARYALWLPAAIGLVLTFVLAALSYRLLETTSSTLPESR